MSENDMNSLKPEFIVTKTVVYGCEIPKIVKHVRTKDLVRILSDSVGTIVNKYVDHYGTSLCVAEFDDNVWAWIGATAYDKLSDEVSS